MNRLSFVLVLVAAATFHSTHFIRAEDHADTAAVAEIKTLIAKYAKSIDDADAKLAAEIWETSDEVSFIQPRGHQKGWDEIKTGFYEKTMGENFTKRKLTPGEPTIRVHGDSAWLVFYWTFEATLKKDHATIQTKGRETQVLEKTAEGWRIVHVHYSNMPVSGEGQGF